MKYILLLSIIFCLCTPKKDEPAAKPVPVAQQNLDTLPVNIRMLDSARNLIRTGDLVLRTGNDMVSYYFKQLNVKDSTYSHCGLADVRNGKVYIYHALGGRYNPSQELLHEPLETFISAEENEGFGIYRLAYSAGEEAQVMNTADSLYKEKVQFDIKFDLNTNKEMYCAEFLYKTIMWGTRGRLTPEIVTIGFRSGVTTDNLYLAPFSREVKRFLYQQ